MIKKMDKNYNLSKLLKGYENKWVALSPDYRRVVSSGDKLQDATSRLTEDERDRMVYLKVISPNYAPFTL